MLHSAPQIKCWHLKTFVKIAAIIGSDVGTNKSEEATPMATQSRPGSTPGFLVTERMDALVMHASPRDTTSMIFEPLDESLILTTRSRRDVQPTGPTERHRPTQHRSHCNPKQISRLRCQLHHRLEIHRRKQKRTRTKQQRTLLCRPRDLTTGNSSL